MIPRPRLLVVDDEEGIRDSLSSVLRDEGYHVETAASAEEALHRAATGDIEVVLLDVWLPGMDGLEALSRIQAIPRPPAVIMISGHGRIETAVRATKLGAFDFIEKPLTIDKVIVLVHNAIQQRRLEEENQRLRSELGRRYQVVGESVPMKALRQQIAVTAPTNGRVLIYGESGTGKELVARALHAASLRSKGPFVEVNCAAIPEELIESEIFGHIKGSFTGATEDKIGKFEKADGGTLFLDEIGELPPPVQVKLLRFLQEQRFQRVGGRQEIQTDVRVIAATNVNLKDAVAKGKFREDLYFRLAVVVLKLPLLRDRGEDVEVLAREFLHQFATQADRAAMTFSPDALRAIKAHSWPGNVRELQNRVKRAVIMADGKRVTAADLELADQGEFVRRRTLKEAREDLERELVQAALKKYAGKITAAAAELGISRPTLYELMEKLGLTKSGPIHDDDTPVKDSVPANG
jgi:two-component system, NtrC family, nitrogen regulation response regulator NtrX